MVAAAGVPASDCPPGALALYVVLAAGARQRPSTGVASFNPFRIRASLSPRMDGDAEEGKRLDVWVVSLRKLKYDTKRAFEYVVQGISSKSLDRFTPH